MTTSPDAIAIQILDKEYMVACPPEEREDLIESARYLDERMRETRDAGKVLGTERMAVMTALNIVHELLQHQREKADTERSFNSLLDGLQSKIEAALTREDSQPA